MANIDAEDVVVGVTMFGCLGASAVMAAMWVTHVVWVVKTLAGAAGITGGQLLLSILGTAFPPLGIIHGGMIWFGMGM